MNSEVKRDSSRPEPQTQGIGGWGLVGLLLLPLLCCGGPALIGLLGASGVGLLIAGAARDWILAGGLFTLALATTIFAI
ncbi:MAG: hypothetical protein OWU32_12665, partial [Firmicutes bacterium]|nr:hypothetical protein [Bacillota bacterium]